MRKHATVKYGSTVHSSVVVCDCQRHDVMCIYSTSSKNFGMKIIILAEF